MKSWKTTLFGLLSAGSGAVVGAYQLKPEMVATLPHWVQGVAFLVSTFSLAAMGIAARDNDKSSEDVGAQSTTGTPVTVKTLPLLLAAGIAIGGVAAGGCQAPAQRIAYNEANAGKVTLENLMTAWGDYVHQFHPGTNVEAKVLALYRKARTAELADIDAAHAYANTVGSTNGVIGTAIEAYHSPEGQAAIAEFADFLRNLGVFNFMKNPPPKSVWMFSPNTNTPR